MESPWVKSRGLFCCWSVNFGEKENAFNDLEVLQVTAPPGADSPQTSPLHQLFHKKILDIDCEDDYTVIEGLQKEIRFVASLGCRGAAVLL